MNLPSYLLQGGDNGQYSASQWATNTGGFSQNALAAMYAAGAQRFNNQGSATWDDQVAGGRASNAAYTPDGDSNPENDFYIQQNPDGTFGLVPILRHGWNKEFVTFAAPIVTAGIAAAAGAGGAAAGAGAGGTEGLSGMDLAADAAAGSGNNIFTAADAFSGAGAAGAAGGTGGGSGGASGAEAGWNPEGYTGGTPQLAGGGGIGGGSGSGLGGLNMDWGDWIKLGGTLASSYLQSNAAGNAADAANAATQAGIGEQRRQFDLTRADFAQYRAAGVGALGQLAGDINKPVTAAEVMQDPGYQFGMQQGQQAIDRKIAAMGGRVSGAAIKEAARYGTDYASTGYNAAYQRKQDRLNRLAAIAGIGQTSTANSAQAGSNAANAITALQQSNAATQGAAGLARSNIWAGTGNQIAAMAGNWFGGNSNPYMSYGGTSRNALTGGTAGNYMEP
jgi:hypothetical protein